VVTEQGDIICQHVVNAGGTYARQIGEWSGLDLPIVNTTHHYIITETVPEFLELEKELPVLRDMGAFSGYFRMEQMSGMLGIYEKKNPNTIWDDGVPWEVTNELFEPHLDRIEPWVNIAMERMPILAKVGVKRIFHGAIPDTPDGNMLLGPAPGLRNYWCCWRPGRHRLGAGRGQISRPVDGPRRRRHQHARVRSAALRHFRRPRLRP
jgi:dimethylglycine dehydrogenase